MIYTVLRERVASVAYALRRRTVKNSVGLREAWPIVNIKLFFCVGNRRCQIKNTLKQSFRDFGCKVIIG